MSFDSRLANPASLHNEIRSSRFGVNGNPDGWTNERSKRPRYNVTHSLYGTYSATGSMGSMLGNSLLTVLPSEPGEDIPKLGKLGTFTAIRQPLKCRVRGYALLLLVEGTIYP